MFTKRTTGPGMVARPSMPRHHRVKQAMSGTRRPVVLLLVCRLLAICWLVSACSLSYNQPSVEAWPVLTNKDWSPDQSSSLDVQYIQVGSILIRYGNDYLLTDPFFSNPPLWRLLLLRNLESDPTIASSLIHDWQGIRGVLVGHGHYDHVLDAPFVLAQTEPTTKLYGSQTVVNMLRPSVSAERLQPVAKKGERLETGWVYVPDSPFRFRAILSEHAPLVGGYRFAAGTVNEPMTKRPQDALDWKEGQTLSYLIDVMSDDGQSEKPEYRIFVQTAASDPPGKFPAHELLKQKDVDLAVLTSGNFDNVQNYPGAWLDRLKPERVLIAHYEPFWRPIDTDSIELMATLDMDEFLKRVNEHIDDGAHVYLPLATSILTID